jgi:hypothetical protein
MWESGAEPDSRSALVPLVYVLAGHPDEEPVADQPCYVNGQTENLHAVLTRTAVVGPVQLDNGDERRLVRHDQVMVDPTSLRWQPKPTPLTQAVHAMARGRAQAKASQAQKRWNAGPRGA